MILLAVDPSSTRTGWAIFDVLASSHELLAAGYVGPKGKDTKLPALDRIRIMAADLADLDVEYGWESVVFEWPDGKVGKRHKGGGAGLSLYGAACGYLLSELESYSWSPEIQTVEPNTWTRSVGKAARHRDLAFRYPQYKQAFAKDPGGDVADAIGLGEWWINEHRVKEATDAAASAVDRQ